MLIWYSIFLGNFRGIIYEKKKCKLNPSQNLWESWLLCDYKQALESFIIFNVKQ